MTDQTASFHQFNDIVENRVPDHLRILKHFMRIHGQTRRRSDQLLQLFRFIGGKETVQSDMIPKRHSLFTDALFGNPQQ